MTEKKAKSIKDVNKRRNRYWLPNAFLFYILRVNLFRDKNLWVFSAWEGNKYDDNSKYLFEYVNKNCPNIKAIWLSDNINIINEVKSLGYKAVVASSREGRSIQLKAGKAFYTNGLDDISNICFIYGAQIICMWHGMGFKKVYYDLIDPRGIRYRLKVFKDKVFSWIYRDITISGSAFSSDKQKRSFRIDDRTFIVTGMPRNDAFSNTYHKNRVFLTIPSADNYRYILYMPTHRPYDDDTIYLTINGLAQSKCFTDFLDKNGIKLVLKLHYLTKIEQANLPESFYVLKDKDISSVQEMLCVSDLLFTDYSSVITDFASQDKPTIIFTPDFEKYCNHVGIIDTIYQLYRCYSKTSIDDLIESIIRGMSDPDSEMTLTNEINSIFQDKTLKGTCYCKNVIDAINRK